MKKYPYSWEDASYLTQRSLGVPHDRWINIGDYNLFVMNFHLLGTTEVEELCVRIILLLCFGLLFWITHALPNIPATLPAYISMVLDLNFTDLVPVINR